MIKRIFRRKTTKHALNKLSAGKILEETKDIGESSASGDGISTEQYDEGSTQQN